MNFRNEIVWRRSPFVGSSKARAKFFPHNHDILLSYSKTSAYKFNADLIPYTEEYKETRFKNPDNDPRWTLAVRCVEDLLAGDIGPPSDRGVVA